MDQIERKSLLYQSGVEYADFCINHVEGCAHGCKYPCYAMNMAKRFGKVKSYDEWIKPKIVSNALELLDKEIPKYKKKIKFVHLSFMTDPFMCGYPEVGELTLKIIKKLNENKIRSSVLTKGIYPKKLKNKEKYGGKNIYGITLTSLNNSYRKRFEPNSAPFRKRIDALRYLSEQGLETWVSIEPYPTPNIVNQDLNIILDNISFANKIIFGKLNYNVKTKEYENNQEFYENCAKMVIGFCNKNKIKHHIKYGTRKKDNKKTEKIFDR